MLVQDVLRSKRPNVVMVTSGQSLRDAAGLLAKHYSGILIVSDDGVHVIGIISERDLIRSVAATESTTVPKVADIMVREVPFCHLTDHLETVRELKIGRAHV